MQRCTKANDDDSKYIQQRQLFEKTFQKRYFQGQCCGTDGPASYNHVLVTHEARNSSISPPAIEASESYLPPTCCAEKVTSLEQLKDTKMVESKTCSKGTAAKDGCLNVVHDFIDYYRGVILKTILAVITFEVSTLFDFMVSVKNIIIDKQLIFRPKNFGSNLKTV